MKEIGGFEISFDLAMNEPLKMKDFYKVAGRSIIELYGNIPREIIAIGIEFVSAFEERYYCYTAQINAEIAAYLEDCLHETLEELLPDLSPQAPFTISLKGNTALFQPGVVSPNVCADMVAIEFPVGMSFFSITTDVDVWTLVVDWSGSGFCKTNECTYLFQK